MRLKGTPASLPLPITRRGEREPAKQPSQRLLNLAIDGGPRPLGLVRGRINPVGRTPDAYIDALLWSINAPAVLASPDDHGLRGRTQLIITVPICGPETSQRCARRSLKCLVRDPPFVGDWLSARQLPDNSPEPLDANTTGRRGRRQLVVIAAADELKPALAAGPLAALILPHRPAADATRDRQAMRRLHEVNISSAPASGRLVLQPAHQPTPPRPQEPPVQPGLLGDVPARVLPRAFSRTGSWYRYSGPRRGSGRTGAMSVDTFSARSAARPAATPISTVSRSSGMNPAERSLAVRSSGRSWPRVFHSTASTLAAKKSRCRAISASSSAPPTPRSRGPSNRPPGPAFRQRGTGGRRATAPGSTEVAAASGVPARPYQDGHDVTFTDPAMPDGPAAMTSAEVPRRPLPTEGYNLDMLAGSRRSRQAADQYRSHQYLRLPGPQTRAPARDYTGATGRLKRDAES